MELDDEVDKEQLDEEEDEDEVLEEEEPHPSRICFSSRDCSPGTGRSPTHSPSLCTAEKRGQRNGVKRREEDGGEEEELSTADSADSDETHVKTHINCT